MFPFISLETSMQRVDSLEKTDAGGDWGQEEKGRTEDEMARWHHQLDGYEFEWTPEVGDEQGSLVCFNSWGRKESHTSELLNWTELKHRKNKIKQKNSCLLNKKDLTQILALLWLSNNVETHKVWEHKRLDVIGGIYYNLQLPLTWTDETRARKELNFVF